MKFRLVVDDASAARAVMMSLHLVNTHAPAGRAGALRLVRRGSSPRISLRRDGALRALWFGALGLFLILGVSGALTALGDTLFPAETLRDGVAQHSRPTHAAAAAARLASGARHHHRRAPLRLGSVAPVGSGPSRG